MKETPSDSQERQRTKREFREWFEPRFLQQIMSMEQECALKGHPVDRVSAIEMVSRRLLSEYSIIKSDGTRVPEEKIAVQKESIREMVEDLKKASLH